MVKKAFPSWRYGPKGQSRIFEEGDLIPKGWEDHPDKVKEPQTKPAAKSTKKDEGKKGDDKKTPERTTEDLGSDEAAAAEEQRYRAEVIEFLKAAGQEPDENASIEELEAQMNAVSPED